MDKRYIAMCCEGFANEVSKQAWYKSLQDKIIIKQREIVSGECTELAAAMNEYDALCLELHSRTEEAIFTKAFAAGALHSNGLTPELTPK